jgi:hypothetical protein
VERDNEARIHENPFPDLIKEEDFLYLSGAAKLFFFGVCVGRDFGDDYPSFELGTKPRPSILST